MRIILTAALAVGLVTGAAAMPTKSHHRTHDSGSSAVRSLNEKSLQASSPATAMTPAPVMAPATPEPNAAAPSGMAPSAPPPSDAAPMPPAPPQ